MNDKDRAALDQLARDLTDRGKIIEAGWIALRMMAVPLDASEVQIEEMRNAFFAGAQHLYASIMGILDPGAEPTDKDLERMEKIHVELDTFIKDYQIRRLPAEGSA